MRGAEDYKKRVTEKKGGVRMKKTLSLILLAALLLTAFAAFSGCAKKRYALVLITDTGSVTDKGFNQSAWDAMTAFAVERDLDCRYFVPSSTNHGDLVSQLRSAAKNGADVIVAPGSIFETAVCEVQHEYPGTKFILIDGRPHRADSQTPDIPSNTTSVMFASEQSGFLAGYAAVSDGITSLGFMGGKPDENVCAYGYGFLQGAEYAAKENGINVSAVYRYTGDFEKNDKNKQDAEKMFTDGADLIFVCGDGVEKSVIEAAESKRCYVICAEKDRRYESGSVLTSAVKGVSAAVTLVLRSVYDTKDFEYSFGGKSTYFDAATGGAGLASFVINDKNGDAFDRFYKFSRSAYESILEKVSSKSIDIKRVITVTDPSGFAKAEELAAGLGLEFVTVTIFE